MRMDFIRELLRSSSRRSWANLDGFGRPVGRKCFRTDGDVAIITTSETLTGTRMGSDQSEKVYRNG